jgi:methyltransferase (TIGR00027 family)
MRIRYTYRIDTHAQPSRTAELMAVQRALESRHAPAARLFQDPLATVFVSRRWRLVLGAARLGLVRRVIEWLYDRTAGPGPRASGVVRTRLIDEALGDAAASATQVVILGAGFDSRAYRLDALADRVTFEVDHPATQAVKRRGLLRAAPLASARVVEFVAVNFERDDLVQTVLDAGYDERAPSVFVWEGVTNYLTPAAVDGTLSAIHRLGCPGSTVLFTYVDRAALGADTAEFPEATRWSEAVRRRGEPWIFGLDPAEVGEFLSRRGFTLVDDTSTADAGEAYFPARGRSERGSALYHVVRASIA